MTTPGSPAGGDGPAGFAERLTRIGDHPVRVRSYPVGARFSARVDNLDPGGNIARASAETREAAETAALEQAAFALELRNATEAMRRSAEALKKVP